MMRFSSVAPLLSIMCIALLGGCVPDLTGAPCTTDANCPDGQSCDATGVCKAGLTEKRLLSVAVTPQSTIVPAGTTQQFMATGKYSDNTSQDLTSVVMWASANTSVATISNGGGSRGLASAIAPGVTTISATLDGLVGSAHLTVGAPRLTSIAVAPPNPSIPKGTTQQFVAIGTYSDNSEQDITSLVTWATTTSEIASISNSTGTKGLATALAMGTTTVTATLSGVNGQTVLNVAVPALTAIGVTPANRSIAKGTTQQFVATGTYSDSTTQDITSLVLWNTSNPTAAIISNNSGMKGLASALDAGLTTISATFSGQTGLTALTVTSATLSSISITPPNPTIGRNTTQQFVATGTYSDGSTQDVTSLVTWASTDTAVATISNSSGSKGLATGVGAGSTTITASLSAVNGSTGLTVIGASLSTVSVTPANPSIPAGIGQQFSAIGTFSDSSTQDLTGTATWASSNSSVATVSDSSPTKGFANALAAGATSVSATASGVSGSTTLTVTSVSLVSISVSPVNPNIAQGTTQQFVAAGTYSDNSTRDITSSVTWASSNTSVASISNAVDSKGLASGTSQGSTTISATLFGVTGSTNLTVTVATLQSISVIPVNPSISRGAKQQFAAIGTYSGGATQDITANVTWTSSTPQVATISNALGSKGLASSASAGSTTIAATSASVTGSTTLTVTP